MGLIHETSIVFSVCTGLSASWNDAIAANNASAWKHLSDNFHGAACVSAASFDRASEKDFTWLSNYAAGEVLRIQLEKIGVIK